MQQRMMVVPQAIGKVLEIGIGSGLNLPFYDSEKVKHLTAIDPSREMWKKNIVDIKRLEFEFEFIHASAEQIPFDNNQFDTAVITYTLCTIPDPQQALSEISRVLKPGGLLLFSEHGKAPDKQVQRWQNILNPVWKNIAGGCNLNRNIKSLIEDNGFTIRKLETNYLTGWKPGSYNYWGSAKIR